MYQEGFWGIWRDNTQKYILVADHLPTENQWKYDTNKHRGHAQWEVAWDLARRKALRAGYKLLCKSNRITLLNTTQK